MSNEELVLKIKAGERELIEKLWEQVRSFIYLQASRRVRNTGGLGGVEVEDLTQSGFFALLEAVEDYELESGYKFLTYLNNRLKTAFSAAGGYLTSRQINDPLHNCASLDAPLGEDGDATLLDFQPDPTDCYEDVEFKIWVEQLHEALERGLSKLPEKEADILRRYYFDGRTLESIANSRSVSRTRIEQQRNSGIRALRRYSRSSKGKELRQYLEDITPYYASVGVSRFNATHTSAVEQAVLKREQISRRWEIRQR